MFSVAILTYLFLAGLLGYGFDLSAGELRLQVSSDSVHYETYSFSEKIERIPITLNDWICVGTKIKGKTAGYWNGQVTCVSKQDQLASVSSLICGPKEYGASTFQISDKKAEKQNGFIISCNMALQPGLDLKEFDPQEGRGQN